MSPRPVGYLFLGMVVFAVRPELLSAGGTVHLLAELGVVFQLFDIGPHFSTAHVRHEAGDIFGFGSLQVSASTILMHSGMGPAELLRQHGITVIVDARLKSGSIAESCRGAHMSGGLSHCRPLTIVDNVPPESIRAAAQDIACRASEVHVLAVGTCAIN